MFSYIPILGSPIIKISGIFTKYINFVIKEFGSLPFATVDLGKTALILSIIQLLCVISALFACKKRNDMLRLKRINEKIIAEGGGRLKWQ